MYIFAQKVKLIKTIQYFSPSRWSQFQCHSSCPQIHQNRHDFEAHTIMKTFFIFCCSCQMWHSFERTRALFSCGVTAAHTEMPNFRWQPSVTVNIWAWCAVKSVFSIRVIDTCIYILLNVNKSNACWSWQYKVNLLVIFSGVTWSKSFSFCINSDTTVSKVLDDNKIHCSRVFSIWYRIGIASARSWRFIWSADWQH